MCWVNAHHAFLHPSRYALRSVENSVTTALALRSIPSILFTALRTLPALTQ